MSYNRFHTTAICSPTRASLLTGRNHHRVGNGQIAELVNDWDGYSGHIPSPAPPWRRCCVITVTTLPRSANGTTPQQRRPPRPGRSTTGRPVSVSNTFYGFLAGEASQCEPNLVRNTTVVPPPRTPEQGYHLSEDLADDAIDWLRRPHRVMKEWADRYAGRFDDGWDAYRETRLRTGQGQGLDPAGGRADRPAPGHGGVGRYPRGRKPFQRRLMEVAAGFAEHCDVRVGRLVDEVERIGYGEDTRLFYIWGDNGSSGEGQNGTISELLGQNGIPSTVPRHIAALEQLGGLDVLGSRRPTTSTTPRGRGPSAPRTRG